MTEILSADAVSEIDGLEDWCPILGRIEAQFRAEGTTTTDAFAAGAAFVAEVARLADEAGHHPDIDLRYPGIVQISLVSHGEGGVTHLDIDLARSISAAAAELGIPSAPTASQRVEIALNTANPVQVQPFWRAILGYVDENPLTIVDPKRIGPAMWFQVTDDPGAAKGRFHLDVSVSHDEAEQRIEAALAAGGTLVSDARAKAFWVIADPEGNLACVCTWQDRS